MNGPGHRNVKSEPSFLDLKLPDEVSGLLPTTDKTPDKITGKLVLIEGQTVPYKEGDTVVINGKPTATDELDWIENHSEGEERQPNKIPDMVPANKDTSLLFQQVEDAKKQMEDHQKILDDLVK